MLGELELYTEPAPERHANEDVIDADGSAAWLLDGASAGDDPRACTEHDAAWYANQLSAAIRDGLALDSRRALTSVLADAIAAVTEQHNRLCPNVPRGHGPTSTVLIVRRRNDGLDYLVLGDSTLLVETNDGTVHDHSDKRLGDVAFEIRAEIHASLRAGHGYETAHRERVAPLRAHEQRVRNTPDGFWIASDTPEAAFHALTGAYPLGEAPSSARRLALISDGLGRAVTHLDLYDDWQSLLVALFDHGTVSCLTTIRKAERRDPSGHSLPRTNPSDDASAVTCKLMPCAAS